MCGGGGGGSCAPVVTASALEALKRHVEGLELLGGILETRAAKLRDEINSLCLAMRPKGETGNVQS